MAAAIRTYSTAVCFLAAISCAVASVDYYFWESAKHPYTTYYLEDYCSAKACKRSGMPTFVLNATGPQSAAVLRAFRSRNVSGDEVADRKMECCVAIETEERRQISVEMEELDMDDRNGDCDKNYVQLSNVSDKPGRFCNSVRTTRRTFTTFTNFLNVRMVVHTGTDDWHQQNAKIVITSVFTPSMSMSLSRNSHALEHARDRIVSSMLSDLAAEIGKESCDARDTFLCDNGRCIWEGFHCDGRNNCGDWSDEQYCDFFSRHWEEILWYVLSAAALITVVSVCCCCWCKPKPEYVYIEGGFGKTGPHRVERYSSSAPPPHCATSYTPPPPPYNEAYSPPTGQKRPLMQNAQPPAYRTC